MRRLSELTVCIIFFILFGVLSGGNEIHAAENKNPLLEGVSIVGPDYTYEYKKEISFTLKIDGEDTNSYEKESEYEKLHYTWNSDNENVAKFVGTKTYYFLGCIGRNYPVLKRPNYFQINSGTAVISCTISDDEGNKVVLLKKLIVLKQTPIKELQFGKCKLTKEDLNADSGTLYTNDITKNMRIQLKLEEGWKLKSESIVSIDTKKDYDFNVSVENENTKQEFCYRLHINRYIVHKISLKNLKPGCTFVKREKITRLIPGYYDFYAVTIEYDKNSQSNDEKTFKDGNDLVKKLIEYYGYNKDLVEYKSGEFIYKETSSIEPLIYCTTKEELNNAKEDVKVRNEFLRGLRIVGPDYVYAMEGTAKFYLDRSEKSSLAEYTQKDIEETYDTFSYKWKSGDLTVAAFGKIIESNSSALKDIHILKVDPGTVVIRCKITDNHGESVILMKKVRILKGRPINNLKVGAYKLKKAELKSAKCQHIIFTKKNKVKLKMKLSKGWKVKTIKVYQGKRKKNITKKKMFAIKPKKKYKVLISLVNVKRGQEFKYECKVKRN